MNGKYPTAKNGESPMLVALGFRIFRFSIGKIDYLFYAAGWILSD
ncbi:hypothetical protein [Vibrio kyushuensis]